MASEFPDRTNNHDENLWLEEIFGKPQLGWVREQNARTLEQFDANALASVQASIRDVYDADTRIPMVSKQGNWLYNLWQDGEHPRGIWRRTTMERYCTSEPEWDVVLDIDALGQSEHTSWVFAGAELCYPDYGRALLRLSPDGGDAVVIREFDVERKQFVDEGFVVPYAKSDATWCDENTVFVSTDFGEGSMTTSGYARELHRWQRGTDLEASEPILEIDKDHMVVDTVHDGTPGYERTLVIDRITFFTSAYYLLQGSNLVAIEVPTDAHIELHRQWLTVQPKTDWMLPQANYAAGSLLAIDIDAFLAGSRAFQVVFAPDDATALQAVSWTQNHLILNLLHHVSSRIHVATPGADTWAITEIETPSLQTTSAWAVDAHESDDWWMLTTGFLQPPTLALGGFDYADAAVLKTVPTMFEAASLQVSQHFAMSDDGTRVPYFQVSHKDAVLDGSNPTLLYAYGGFEISRVPAYEADTGREWLARGGVYAVANIRGGGEYGPSWHTCALRENRHRAYEDSAAVARDLVARGVTSTSRLGCMGGSNGGLLVGNMLTHYPELFGAIVCTVPLLDMKRYTHLSAGASWVAEYGDPDIEDDWAFIQTFSPYHNLREGVVYPPVLFYTATSDDRVGPVQARKMASRMQQRGIANVWFYENMLGGHGGAADNGERAHMKAMTLEFLRAHLRRD